MSAIDLPNSLRVRLTLWHASFLTLLLVAYAGFVFFIVRQELLAALDAQLHEDLERAEESLQRAPDGTLAWNRAGYRHDEQDEEPLRWIEVWHEGRLIARQPPGDRDGQPRLPPPPPAPEEAALSLEIAGDRHVRVLQRAQTVAGTPVQIRAVRSEDRLNDELGVLALVLMLGLPLAVLAVGTGGYLIARRALSPVDRMTDRARRITADFLRERLPVDNPDDELGRLAATFNAMFSRLERSFEQLRQFTTDASHELRTPLTAIRTVGEVGLRQARTPQQYREAIGSMLEETDHLTRLVDALLILSRTDSASDALILAPVELGELAENVAEHMGALAEEKGQRIDVQIPVAPVQVQADRTLLRQALLNLLDNAVKYSPEGTTVHVTVRREPDRALLEVADEGPGIPPEHQERVFDRFFRADPSRTRGGGGFGLGLSLARLAVERQGGRIDVGDRQGGGALFRIVLALTPEAASAASSHQNSPT